MTSKLSLNIFRLLHRKTRSTSIRRLEQRGMRHVSVLNVKDLHGLIREAVNSTLQEMGISLTQEELQQVNDRTREEFLKVLNDRDELKDTVRTMEMEITNLKGNLQLLRTELEVNNRLLADEQNRQIERETVPISRQKLDGIQESLLARLTELFTEHSADEELKDKAIRATLDLIEEERERAFQNAKASQEDRVTNLKRRIAKLSAKLEQTENLLSRVRTEGPFEDGVPSEFRGVQGLNQEATFFEEKKALLKEIFHLNMDLKKIMAET